MIDIDIQISISERSSGWAVNYQWHCRIIMRLMMMQKRSHFHNPPALDQKTAAAQNYPDVPLHKTTWSRDMITGKTTPTENNTNFDIMVKKVTPKKWAMKKFLHSKRQFPFFKDVSKIAQNKLKPRHDGTENKSSLRKRHLQHWLWHRKHSLFTKDCYRQIQEYRYKWTSW